MLSGSTLQVNSERKSEALISALIIIANKPGNCNYVGQQNNNHIDHQAVNIDGCINCAHRVVILNGTTVNKLNVSSYVKDSDNQHLICENNLAKSAQIVESLSRQQQQQQNPTTHTKQIAASIQRQKQFNLVCRLKKFKADRRLRLKQQQQQQRFLTTRVLRDDRESKSNAKTVVQQEDKLESSSSLAQAKYTLFGQQLKLQTIISSSTSTLTVEKKEFELNNKSKSKSIATDNSCCKQNLGFSLKEDNNQTKSTRLNNITPLIALKKFDDNQIKKAAKNHCFSLVSYKKRDKHKTLHITNTTTIENNNNNNSTNCAKLKPTKTRYSLTRLLTVSDKLLNSLLEFAKRQVKEQHYCNSLQALNHNSKFKAPSVAVNGSCIVGVRSAKVQLVRRRRSLRCANNALQIQSTLANAAQQSLPPPPPTIFARMDQENENDAVESFTNSCNCNSTTQTSTTTTTAATSNATNSRALSRFDASSTRLNASNQATTPLPQQSSSVQLQTNHPATNLSAFVEQKALQSVSIQSPVLPFACHTTTSAASRLNLKSSSPPIQQLPVNNRREEEEKEEEKERKEEVYNSKSTSHQVNTSSTSSQCSIERKSDCKLKKPTVGQKIMNLLPVAASKLHYSASFVNLWPLKRDNSRTNSHSIADECINTRGDVATLAYIKRKKFDVDDDDGNESDDDDDVDDCDQNDDDDGDGDDDDDNDNGAREKRTASEDRDNNSTRGRRRSLLLDSRSPKTNFCKHKQNLNNDQLPKVFANDDGYELNQPSSSNSSSCSNSSSSGTSLKSKHKHQSPQLQQQNQQQQQSNKKINKTSKKAKENCDITNQKHKMQVDDSCEKTRVKQQKESKSFKSTAKSKLNMSASSSTISMAARATLRISRSLLNVDFAASNAASDSTSNQDSASASSRQSKESTKDKRRKRKEAEKLEKLQQLVSYLRSGSSSPRALDLEADELELARNYKHNLVLCDTCLHTFDSSSQTSSTSGNLLALPDANGDSDTSKRFGKSQSDACEPNQQASTTTAQRSISNSCNNWSNAGSLASWIDHEINTLVNDLEKNSARL